MTNRKRTMKQFSYGIKRPDDLLAKLKQDGEKLTPSPHPYDVFNFVVTAAVLAEWIQKFYCSCAAPKSFSAPSKTRKTWLLPEISSQWITDTTCLPNRGCDFNRHISNVLSICTHTANASKHFHWQDQGEVQAISASPPIRNFYQWFFTSTAPDLYLNFEGENYGLQQIKSILLQFYTGLIKYLDELQVQAQNNGPLDLTK